MKIFFIILTSLLLYAKDSRVERLKLSKEMLEVMNKNGYMDMLVKRVIDEQISQNPILSLNPQKAKAFSYRYLSYKSLKPDLTKIYAKELNADELKAWTEFCKSKAGQRILRKLPRLINISSYIAQKKIQSHYKELVNSIMK